MSVGIIVVGNRETYWVDVGKTILLKGGDFVQEVVNVGQHGVVTARSLSSSKTLIVIMAIWSSGEGPFTQAKHVKSFL